ncbi:hypothetical protein NI17_010190 [Thermobifida halotolerans]|uniref:Histidine kinase/HSP90-like ATPase domain-containing protein n=1 Tax=Thermobifida halotolerans TaxID=483545 RepID=A0AA97M0N5_9ACTN|nr:hypothetical protein [Thermobifida halotolerans]UOE21441.1 hypothetical protein NI17_010190 [Thermobifida halotolerans]
MTVAFTSFPGLPASVAAARRFVVGAVRLCPRSTAPDEVVERAELITSELATNAIRHVRHEVARFQWLHRMEVLIRAM